MTIELKIEGDQVYFPFSKRICIRTQIHAHLLSLVPISKISSPKVSKLMIIDRHSTLLNKAMNVDKISLKDSNNSIISSERLLFRFNA